MISDSNAVQRLAELGHPTRLAIFRMLIKCYGTDVTVGTIQRELGVPASTLSHHVSRLVNAGLIQQQRDGRELLCRAKLASLHELMAYLTAECCTESCA